MRKREFVFAAIAAAMLSVGTAKTASAQAANCADTCDQAFGTWFYQPTYWQDDFGQIGDPGWWGLVDCQEVGDVTICYYQQ